MVGVFKEEVGTTSTLGGITFAVWSESTPVPEPATMLLFGTGLAGLVGSRLRRRKK